MYLAVIVMDNYRYEIFATSKFILGLLTLNDVAHKLEYIGSM